MRRQKKKKTIFREILNWFIYLFIIVGAIYLFIHFVGDRIQANEDSMFPVISNGDNLLVDKVSYHFREPSRYEIVVFPFQYQKDKNYIKRIIGLPGETIQIVNGNIMINGKKLDDPYGREIIQNAGIVSKAVTLKQNEYFVLGDNRNNSVDSREPSVGMISEDNIIGRILMRIWPFDRIGFLTH